MALIKCKECGSAISNKAVSCPQCGAKRPKKT
ncbi:zinc-ribbon domain-containing protein [Ampullimonas aquatilis]